MIALETRTYELMVLLRPELTDEQVTNYLDHWKQTISEENGSIVKIEKWGIRKLAYKVQKVRYGYYCMVYFNGTPAIIEELTRRFNIEEQVMKFLFLNIKPEWIKDMSHFISPESMEMPPDHRGRTKPTEDDDDKQDSTDVETETEIDDTENEEETSTEIDEDDETTPESPDDEEEQ